MLGEEEHDGRHYGKDGDLATKEQVQFLADMGSITFYQLQFQLHTNCSISFIIYISVLDYRFTFILMIDSQ